MDNKAKNPLLRTPGRELRRYAAVAWGVCAIALVVVLVVGSRLGGGGATPASDSTTIGPIVVESDAGTTAPAGAGPDSGVTGTVTRAVSVRCEDACTLVLTATGESEVALTVNGAITRTEPLLTDAARSTVRVTGSGVIEATATAQGRVDLSVADESADQP